MPTPNPGTSEGLQNITDDSQKPSALFILRNLLDKSASKEEADFARKSFLDALRDPETGDLAFFNLTPENALTLKSLSTQVESNSALIETIATKVESNTAQIEAISTTVESNSTQFKWISEQFGSISTQLESLSTKIEENSTQFSSQFQSLSTKVKKLSTTGKSLSAEVKANSAEVKLLSKDVEKIASELKSFRATIGLIAVISTAFIALLFTLIFNLVNESSSKLEKWMPIQEAQMKVLSDSIWQLKLDLKSSPSASTTGQRAPDTNNGQQPAPGDPALTESPAQSPPATDSGGIRAPQ
ncbi:MAG: hypothetical protein LBT40_04175 [Deltaproteobacteria bacterium]|nr:hypothetical protein [Deltaproteobacteria bacterium]